ncbi:MAG: hypothetical protein IRY85_10000 [Micromonosporaceae bacterium]|nr:hypothetical protein [Micromonosporaceae bacterium]
MRRLAVAAAVVVMAACVLAAMVVALPFIVVGYLVDLLRVRRHEPADPYADVIASGLLTDWVPRTPGEQLADEVEEWLCANYCPHSTEEH